MNKTNVINTNSIDFNMNYLGFLSDKNMKQIIAFITFILFLFTSLPTLADNSDIHENAGTRAMTFLKIGVGAKAIGMGESQVAATDDLYAAFWNPAGLINLERPQLALMHNEWFAEINQEFVGIALPIGKSNTVGISANFLSFGDIQGRDENGNLTEIFRPYDLAMVLSYARGFGNKMSFGINAKYIREQISDENGTGVAFDFGGLYTLPKLPLSIGINAQNVGPRVKYVEDAFQLPFVLRVGTAYRFFNDNAILSMDFIRPTDNDNAFAAGIGYTIANTLQIRTGYKYQLGGNDLGAISGLTGGFGLSILRFQIDYALVSFGDLGLTHRLSLIAHF